MALAASQARFLGLTARKSNKEYEGQQVNQQRMALAEEVNSLQKKLNTISRPIPPDTMQFYKTNYQFELSNTSSSDGKYTITNYFNKNDGSAYPYTIYAIRTYEKYAATGTKVPSNTVSKKTEQGETVYYYTPVGATSSYELEEVPNSKAIIDLINESYPGEKQLDPDTDSIYAYTDPDSKTVFYFAKSELDSAQSVQQISRYNLGNKTVSETVRFDNASIEFDENTQRMSKVTIQDVGSSDVDAVRTHDDEGYEAALRDYTMSTDEYNKAIADINAQTESLQQEDKILEMRLNQIDTEQKELATELDAVKEVLKKNIETTFKTFA